MTPLPNTKHSKSNRAVTAIPETLRLPFLCLSKYGFCSTNPFRKYFLTTVFAFTLSSWVILAMMQFINMKKDVSDIVRNLEGLFGFGQILGKIIFTVHRSNNLRLVKKTKLFSSFNQSNHQAKIINRLVFRLQKLFFLVLYMGIFGVMVLLLLNVPIGIWTFDGYEKLYRFIMIEQFAILPFCGVFLWAIDSMYIGFCAEIVIQFRILSDHVKELSVESNNLFEMEKDYLNKIKNCIRHHQLILRFIKEFRKSFSLILCFECVTVGILICSELFAVFESDSFHMKIRHAIVFIALGLQLSMYCIPADYILEEGLAVANAVYFSKWYSHYFPSLKIPLLVMMQNAQNEITIKACGLIPINANTVVNVFKVAWSVCSLARGLRQN